MSYISNKRVNLEIAKGNVPEHVLLHLTGYNSDIDAAEDVWPNGGDFVPPTQARIHNIVSSSTNDDSAGTGARTVNVIGIDSGGSELSETVTMDGTTNVATSGSYLMINDMVVKTAGTSLANEGIITATAQTDSTVTSTIPADLGKSLQSTYQLPRGCVLHLDDWSISVDTTNSTSSECIAVLLSKETSGAWNVVSRINSTANTQGSEKVTFDSYISFGGGTMFKVRVTNLADTNLDVTTRINATLIKSVVPATGAILLESGLGYLLAEDGGRLLLE